ncbi:MAG: hypothetical protein ACI83W_002143 [Marinoscillum sp.]|jgi:hypothetical protein
MKKLLPHIIYILIIAFFIVYANIKANETDKYAALADIRSELAEKNAQDAKRQAELGEQMAAESVKQQRSALEALQKAEETLANCKSKK